MGRVTDDIYNLYEEITRFFKTKIVQVVLFYKTELLSSVRKLFLQPPFELS
jgi:hypothetical protein